MTYQAAESRYAALPYRACGASGLKLSAVSLGLWHNFGHVDRYDTARELVQHAFDCGITHFDLANNYGPPPGSAELVFGQILRDGFAAYRDEIVVSTKAGYVMQPGPYGDGGSRKYLIASCDASLKRMGLDYVDIFYHHRPDPATPLAETMAALDHLVRSGRALYVGVSNYPPELTRQAATLLRNLGTPCVIHQARYNLLDRQIEDGLLDALHDDGIGCIAFSPLAQGLLTDKYLHGAIPEGSRAAKAHGFLKAADVTPSRLAVIERLNTIARERGQTLAQMALGWVLRHADMTSVLIGASCAQQIDDAVDALTATELLGEELSAIDLALGL